MARQKRGAGILQLQELSHALLGHALGQAPLFSQTANVMEAVWTSPCSKSVKDKCTSAAGSTMFPFLLRYHSLMRESGGAFLPPRLHYDLMGNGRYQVNKKIQGECFGRAVVAMSEPSGCVFAQRHYRGWPWLTWWCNNHQEMFCSTHGHASPSYTCQSHNLPCHQALPVLLLQGLRGFHRQRCFTAERLSWRRTGAAPPKQHTAALHRRIIIYRDLVGMCSTKSFTTFKIPYLLFMRDLSNIY